MVVATRRMFILANAPEAGQKFQNCPHRTSKGALLDSRVMKKGEAPSSATDLPEWPLEGFGAFAASNTMVLGEVGLTAEARKRSSRK
jgi:hypothetical protein